MISIEDLMRFLNLYEWEMIFNSNNQVFIQDANTGESLYIFERHDHLVNFLIENYPDHFNS